jgi:hypothetical protein
MRDMERGQLDEPIPTSLLPCERNYFCRARRLATLQIMGNRGSFHPLTARMRGCADARANAPLADGGAQKQAPLDAKYMVAVI